MVALKELRTKDYHRCRETAPRNSYVVHWQATLLTEKLGASGLCTFLLGLTELDYP